MNALFATPGAIIMTALFVMLEIASIAALCLGLLCYRAIVMNHRGLLSSLRQNGKRAGRRSMGSVAWIYLVSTFAIVVMATAFFLWQPLAP